MDDLTIAAGQDSSASSDRWDSVTKGFAWVVLSIAGAAVVGSATASGSPAPALAFMLLLLLGAISFRGESFQYFALAYGFNVLALLGLAWFLMRTRGEPFMSGGDDLLFFETSGEIGRALLRGEWSALKNYTHYSGYGYILLGAALNVVTAPLGDISPLTIRVFGAFVGATLGPAVLYLARTLYPREPPEFSRSCAMAVSGFPLLTFYSGTGLRDIWLAAAATWFIASLIGTRVLSRRQRFHWVAPVVLLTVTAFLRPLSTVPLVIFWVFLVYGYRQNAAALATAVAIAVGGLAIIGLMFDTIVREIVREQLKYAFATVQAAPGSLGARLLQLPSPANELARFVYAIFVPIPPMTGWGFDQLLLGTGAAIWYFVVPFAFVGMSSTARIDKTHSAVVKSTAAFAVTLLAGVALTSVDVRHKLPLVALALMFSLVGSASLGKRNTTRVAVTLLLVYGALAVLYLSLKLL